MTGQSSIYIRDNLMAENEKSKKSNKSEKSTVVSKVREAVASYMTRPRLLTLAGTITSIVAIVGATRALRR